MARWPKSISKALQLLDNQYPGDELSVEAFASFWGGLDVEHFLLAVDKGDGQDDTLFAILTLDALNIPSLVELLVSWMESPYPKVRWVSAYCLGCRRDERALPLLYHCLTEFLPPDEQYVEYGGQTYLDWFYEEWRPIVQELLQNWKGYGV